MVFRRAAAFGFVLSATLATATAAGAQGFFGLFEMSPGQIVRALDDDGYELRGPLVRRGDVYLCDAVSEESGRSVRLIVSARDGRVIQRFAGVARYRDLDGDYDPRAPRPPRDVAEPRRSDDEEDMPVERHDRMALGDPFNPPSRVYGSDSLFGPRPAPAPAPDASMSAKPKRQAVKKHKDPAVAKAPGGAPSPQPAPDPAKTTNPAVANVAPAAKPDIPAADAPKSVEPQKSVEPPKSVEAPKPVETPSAEIEKPKPVETPKPAAAPLKTAAQSSDAQPVKADPKPEPKPENKPAAKKLNDLPVGTLD